MSSIENNYKQQAKKIAVFLDRLDGKNNKIDAKTWQDYAVKNWGAKDNVSSFISIFNAEKSIEKYIKREAVTSGLSANAVGEKWYSDLVAITDKTLQETQQTQQTQNVSDVQSVNVPAEQPDALKVDNSNNQISSEYIVQKNDILAKLNDINREKIVSNMYAKWSDKFKKSPLGKDFYEKLYDTIKVLNCSIKDSDFNKSAYSSKEEQTMDEFIAIIAGEAQLNPLAKNGQYRGLFQLATAGLIDLKRWAKDHQDVPGMKNIKNININQFAKLSGVEQLDYLVAYIGKSKEYSKLPEDKTVTPGQVWAMIKYPFQGQLNSRITAQKTNAIQRVFKNSGIQLGSQA